MGGTLDGPCPVPSEVEDTHVTEPKRTGYETMRESTFELHACGVESDHRNSSDLGAGFAFSKASRAFGATCMVRNCMLHYKCHSYSYNLHYHFFIYFRITRTPFPPLA